MKTTSSAPMRAMPRESCLGVMFLMTAALASACGDDASGGVDAPPQPDTPPMATPVTGTAIDTFGTAQGDVQVPRDLSGATIAALVPAADGSFTTFPGRGTSQGTFEIPGVPEGPYYLSLEGRFIITSARTLDIGRRNVGRSTQRAVAATTPLTFDVTGMAAWQPDDFLELYAPNAGAAFSNVELFAEPAPVVGATTLGITVDYRSGESPMVLDPALGDEAFLTHNISHVSTEGVPYQSLGAISYLQPFSLAGGLTVTAQGAFQAIPQDRTRSIDWRSTEYASLINTAVPGGTTTFASSFAGFADLDVRALYSLPVVFNLQAPLTPDVLATVRYGNPFPAAWKEHIRITVFGFKQFTAGGKNGNSLAGASISGAADDLLAGPIRPTIGVVRNLRVAGQDGAGAITGLPAHPTITWDPPGMGTANSYFVQVSRFVPDATRLNRLSVARFSTTGTSVTLPDGILKAGEPHFITVRALSHPSIGFERFPFVNSYPIATADRITTVFTP